MVASKGTQVITMRLWSCEMRVMRLWDGWVECVCDDEMRMRMATMRIMVHDNNQENKANNMHNENEQDIRYARDTVRTAVIHTKTIERDSNPVRGKRQNTRKSTENNERPREMSERNTDTRQYTHPWPT